MLTLEAMGCLLPDPRGAAPGVPVHTHTPWRAPASVLPPATLACLSYLVQALRVVKELAQGATVTE